MGELIASTVSIVIVNYNGRHLIEACLHATVEQARALSAEVVFVDNASTDGSVSFVRQEFPGVVVIENETNQGFAGGCNTGFRAASGELVVLLNNDAVPEPGWLEHLLAAAEPNDVAVACSVINELNYPREYALGTGSISVIGHPIPNVARDLDSPFYATGCSLVFKRSLTGEPFPAIFFAYFEDTVLSWRARLGGYRVARALDSEVQHMGSATASQMPSLALYYYERNKLLMLLGCYDRSTLLRLVPLYLFDAVVRLLRDLWLVAKADSRPESVKRLAAHYGIVARAVAWVATHSREVSRLRQSIQCERRKPDSAITRMLSGKIFDDIRSTRGQTLVNRLAVVYCRLVGIRTAETIAPG